MKKPVKLARDSWSNGLAMQSVSPCTIHKADDLTHNIIYVADSVVDKPRTKGCSITSFVTGFPVCVALFSTIHMTSVSRFRLDGCSRACSSSSKGVRNCRSPPESPRPGRTWP
jgi:hypothetical protein